MHATWDSIRDCAYKENEDWKPYAQEVATKLDEYDFDHNKPFEFQLPNKLTYCIAKCQSDDRMCTDAACKFIQYMEVTIVESGKPDRRVRKPETQKPVWRRQRKPPKPDSKKHPPKYAYWKWLDVDYHYTKSGTVLSAYKAGSFQQYNGMVLEEMNAHDFKYPFEYTVGTKHYFIEKVPSHNICKRFKCEYLQYRVEYNTKSFKRSLQPSYIKDTQSMRPVWRIVKTWDNEWVPASNGKVTFHEGVPPKDMKNGYDPQKWQVWLDDKNDGEWLPLDERLSRKLSAYFASNKTIDKNEYYDNRTGEYDGDAQIIRRIVRDTHHDECWFYQDRRLNTQLDYDLTGSKPGAILHGRKKRPVHAPNAQWKNVKKVYKKGKPIIGRGRFVYGHEWIPDGWKDTRRRLNGTARRLLRLHEL